MNDERIEAATGSDDDPVITRRMVGGILSAVQEAGLDPVALVCVVGADLANRGISRKALVSTLIDALGFGHDSAELRAVVSGAAAEFRMERSAYDERMKAIAARGLLDGMTAAAAARPDGELLQ